VSFYRSSAYGHFLQRQVFIMAANNFLSRFESVDNLNV